MNSTPQTILYSSRNCHYCQRVRLVLHEKRVPFETVMVDEDEEKPAELAETNPYGILPTLQDRDLVLFFADVIIEYLEERYPHPPLMPEVPTERAKLRTYMRQIDREWSSSVDKLANPGYSRSHVIRRNREELKRSVITVAPIFNDKPYYMGEDMTLADCCALPILWRLPLLGISIPHTRQVRAMFEYLDRMKKTTTFQESLTAEEKELMLTKAARD